jgi:hypothetical protein
MTLAAEQAKNEKRLFWLLEVELTYRIEGKTWTQDDAPNTSCWYMAHGTEGNPSRVFQLLRSTHAVTDYGAAKGSLAACQAAASSWFYDSATGRLHVHMSAGDAPDTASKYYLRSHFWKTFSTHQYEAPDTIYDSAGMFVEPRLGKTPSELTQEVNDFTEVGLRETWGSVEIANGDGKYDAALTTYIWHMCRFLLKVGAKGDPYANLVVINRGRTGSVGWDDNTISLGFEDSVRAED